MLKPDFEKKSNLFDLTIISNLNVADGIGRQGLGLLSCLKEDLSINTLFIPPAQYKDVQKDLLPTIAKPFSGQYGKISFWTYILGLNENLVSLHSSLKSEIKIAYSMFESDAIPKFWTRILNDHYDLVCVPDEYLVEVYKSSGVKIPIFVLPLGIWLEPFINSERIIRPRKPFTFGISAGFYERKNHLKVLVAFKNEFGNNPEFKLKLHGRFGPIKSKIESEVSRLKLNNVELISKPFSQQEYLEWFRSIDCYVYPSMGEGFSITPREALSLGIPTIISSNSVHKTICNSGFVKSIPARKKVPAIYELFGGQVGNCFDIDLVDLQKAMVDISKPEAYLDWIEAVKSAKNWTNQYLWSELKPFYLSLIKPKLILKSNKNSINKNSIEIEDKKLYEKYCKAFGG